MAHASAVTAGFKGFAPKGLKAMGVMLKDTKHISHPFTTTSHSLFANAHPYAKNLVQGVVVQSGVSNKTVTVAIGTLLYNKKYNRHYIQVNKHLVHDENNTSNSGDVVLLKDLGKRSNQKKLTLVSILKRTGGGKFLEQFPEYKVTREDRAKRLKEEKQKRKQAEEARKAATTKAREAQMLLIRKNIEESRVKEEEEKKQQELLAQKKAKAAQEKLRKQEVQRRLREKYGLKKDSEVDSNETKDNANAEDEFTKE